MSSVFELFPGSIVSNVPKDIKRKSLSTKNYIICITPRSGSTWLGDLITQTHMLGNPVEWFNPGRIETRIKKLQISNFFEYVDITRRQTSTPNGIFGIEVSYPHLNMALEALSIEQIFGDMPIWFYLTRKNIVLQSISLYLSAASGYFHSFDQREDVRDKYLSIDYDPDRIAKCCVDILEHERNFEGIFEQYQIAPIRLTYEDILPSPQRVLRLFCNVLQVKYDLLKFQTDEKVQKISNDRNQRWEERFRKERAGFIKELSESKREFALYRNEDQS